MAENAEAGQKTQQPTAKKKADAIKQGDILASRELATALMMLAGTFWVAFAGLWFVEAAQQLLRHGLNLSPADVRDFAPARAMLRDGAMVAAPLGMLFAASLIASIAGTAMLGSLGWRSSGFAFKGKKLNPLTGLKRMAGPQAAIELGKAVAKVLVLGAIGYYVVAGSLPTIMAGARTDVAVGAALASRTVITAMLALSVGLVVIALIDVPVQWFQRNRRLMMTVQEVRREMRESDGAPELKDRQRSRQREILSGSARRAVTDATVVLTNPTHFSVALRYRPGIDLAPVVVARGRGEIALAIRTLAREAAVPILEYPQLTRAIYFSSRAGRMIEEELFVAVATVLAFVFQLERAAAAAMAQPTVEVPPAYCFDQEGKRAG